VDDGWMGRRVVARPGTRDSSADAEADSETVARAAEGFAPTGGYAEQAVASAQALFSVPDGLGLREATALINDGLTAMQLAEAAQVRPGERVLITPAGGGLGSLLVQLTHAAGAHVVAAACGHRKLNLARELGAHAAVDYSREGWPERVLEATDGRGPDVILDGVGGEIGRAAFGVAARGGRFFAFGSPSGGFTMIEEQEAQRREVRVVGLMELQLGPGDERRLAEQALSEAAAGRVRPVVGQTFPLEKAAEAHSAMEAREVIGKTLLLIR